MYMSYNTIYVPRCLTQSSNRTTRLSQYISWSRTQTRLTASTTRLCTTSASGRWSWLRRRTPTSTISSPRRCLASLPASASPASSTPISVSLPSTWSRSPVSTSSCPASPRWRPGAASSTAPLLCQSWRSRCSTPRTWWPPAIHATVATWRSPPCSADGCQWKRWVLIRVEVACSKGWSLDLYTHYIELVFFWWRRLIILYFVKILYRGSACS